MITMAVTTLLTIPLASLLKGEKPQKTEIALEQG
jgi:hypothetical protein